MTRQTVVYYLIWISYKGSSSYYRCLKEVVYNCWDSLRAFSWDTSKNLPGCLYWNNKYLEKSIFLWFYDSASLEFYLKEASLKWWHFFTTHFCTFNILCLSNMWQELCQGLGEITRNVKNLLSKYLPMTIKFQARYRWWSLSFFCFMSYSHVITFSFF